MDFEQWWERWQQTTGQRFSEYDKTFAEEAWNYQQIRIDHGQAALSRCVKELRQYYTNDWIVNEILNLKEP